MLNYLVDAKFLNWNISVNVISSVAIFSRLYCFFRKGCEVWYFKIRRSIEVKNKMLTNLITKLFRNENLEHLETFSPQHPNNWEPKYFFVYIIPNFIKKLLLRN